MNTQFYPLAIWMALIYAYLLHPKPFHRLLCSVLFTKKIDLSRQHKFYLTIGLLLAAITKAPSSGSLMFGF